MSRPTVLTAFAVLAVLAAGVLSGCGPVDPSGVSGKITDRYQEYDPASKLLLDKFVINGHTYEVTDNAYGKCFRGSRYPDCKNR